MEQTTSATTSVHTVILENPDRDEISNKSEQSRCEFSAKMGKLRVSSQTEGCAIIKTLPQLK